MKRILLFICGILVTAFCIWVFVKIAMADGMGEMEHDQWVDRLSKPHPTDSDGDDDSGQPIDMIIREWEQKAKADVIKQSNDDLCQPRNYHYKP